MAQGSKAKYTSKQKRMASHIENSEKKSGASAKRAAQIGWATVNKETGGAGKKIKTKSSSKKGGSMSHAKSRTSHARKQTSHHASAH